MGFAELKKQMTETAFKKFGVDGVYKSKLNGVPVKVRIILKHNFESNPGALLTGVSEKITAIDFLYTQVSDPRAGDTVIVEGEKFTVDDELGNDHIKVMVSVK